MCKLSFMHVPRIDRRSFLKASLAGATLGARTARAESQPPNIIFILTDDLGFGDLGCYGSDIATPNIDGMAAEGVRFTNFYSASPVCSPSRAALLTGRYPTRVGVPRVFLTNETSGLSLTETTLAQTLKTQNYSTMCIGKWHLGTQPQYMPNKRGFDQFFGLPYSNDMTPLPLLRNTDVIEQPANQDTLTQRYTAEALNFITNSKNSPFFLYLAHTFPHIPLAASAAFRGKSGLGLYGDCIEEIDWSVGQILSALKANNLDNNTLVMFTSDNGPWFQGSPGNLRGRKGETFEGGMREPFIARFPGRISPVTRGRVSTSRPAGRVNRSVATMLDIFPTLARLAGATLPANRLDGVDIWPVLSGDQPSVERPPFFYFDDLNLQCARVGRWKLHVARYNSFPWTPDPAVGRINLPLLNPELYNLDSDPQEGYDVAVEHPDIVASIRDQIEAAIPTFPADVQIAWQATKAQKVVWTPDGALPAPLLPR